VLAGAPQLIGIASFDMIPGVFLIDRDFVLRAQSLGPMGLGSDLFKELLPMAGRLAASPN
jgi:hypothetical protein